MSIAPTIHRLVLDLANGSLPNDGMLFYNQINKLNLNYNEESLQKLDSLLTQLGKKAAQDPRYQVQELLKLEGGNILFLSLSGYIGNYIARKISKISDIKTTWLGDANIANSLQTESHNYLMYASELTFMTGNTPNFPMQAIFEKLANAENPEKSLTEYVTNILNNNGMNLPSIARQKAQSAKQVSTPVANSATPPATDNNGYANITPELLAQLQAQKESIKGNISEAGSNPNSILKKGVKIGSKKGLLRGAASLFLDDD